MFVSKLVDSAGEAGETEVWLDVSKDCEYMDNERYKNLFSKYDEVNKMLYSMINNLEKFCPNSD